MANTKITDLTLATSPPPATNFYVDAEEDVTNEKIPASMITLEHTAVSADADQAMAVGKLYVVTMGAWASDNIFSLPTTAKVGERIGIYIVDGDASYKLQIRTTAASNDTINGVDYDSADWAKLFVAGEYVVFRCITADTAWIAEEDGRVPDHSFTEGGLFVWDSATGYHIEPGVKRVNGELLEWTSNITRSSLSLTASTGYYVYLYNNAGTPALEESTTVPVKDTDLGTHYYKKTGDASRRWVGYLHAETTSTNISRFVAGFKGNEQLEVHYNPNTSMGGAGLFPVTTGFSETNWTSFSLSPGVPVLASSWLVHININVTTVDTMLTAAVSSIDMGSGSNPLWASIYAQLASSVAGQLQVPGEFLPIKTAQTAYYKTNAMDSGTDGDTNIGIHGFRIPL
jgi:hypothetical protein